MLTHRRIRQVGKRQNVTQVLIAYDDTQDQNIVAVFRGDKPRFYHVDVHTVGVVAHVLNCVGATFHGQTFTDHMVVEAVTL